MGLFSVCDCSALSVCHQTVVMMALKKSLSDIILDILQIFTACHMSYTVRSTADSLGLRLDSVCLLVLLSFLLCHTAGHDKLE